MAYTAPLVVNPRPGPNPGASPGYHMVAVLVKVYGPVIQTCEYRANIQFDLSWS